MDAGEKNIFLLFVLTNIKRFIHPNKIQNKMKKVIPGESFNIPVLFYILKK